MSNNREVSKKRGDLARQERELLAEIEGESQKLERKVEKIAKNSLIIGSGLLLGYAAYRGMSGEKRSKVAALTSSEPSSKGSKISKNIGKHLFSEAVKKGILMLFDGFRNPSNKS